MTYKLKISVEQWLLMIIIVVAGVLRFYNYANLSITGDEISAILRLRFNSFKELIDIGVRPDGHPAGVQVFLYWWTSLFGISEASIRFPFVLSGILSVYFIYLIGRDWFNKNSGLFVAAALCFLQFPLLYSQIARPYSPGLLLTLMATWYWSRLLFYKNRHKALIIIMLALSSVGAMYTHYFSFFQVMLIGITGLFYLNKNNYKDYLICLGLVFILFVPHIGVSLDHLQIGGLAEAEWLASPDQDGHWFLNYLLFCFNDSWQMIAVFLVILVLTLIKPQFGLSTIKFRFLAIVWFLIPFFVGYYYSVWVNPVLQRSVLLFSFPFLLLLAFSFIPQPSNIKRLYPLLVLFLVIGVFSTTVINQFYSNHRFGVLKELAEKALKYQKDYGAQNITKTINIGHPYFIEYYLEKEGTNVDYMPFHTDNVLHKYRNNGRAELLSFKTLVDNSETEYFLYQWSSKYSPKEIPEIIKDKYPNLIDKELYFNSETYLFGRNKIKKFIQNKYLFSTLLDFESHALEWNGDSAFLSSDFAFSGEYSEKLSNEHEYSYVFSRRIGDVFKSQENIINISVMGNFVKENSDANLVVSLSSPEGEAYSWKGMNFSYFIKKPYEWRKIYHSVRFHNIQSPDDIIKVYVWNNGGKPIYIDDFKITVSEGNPKIYGKRDVSL